MSAPTNDGPVTAAELGVTPPPDMVIPPPAAREDVAKTADFIHRRGDSVLEGLRTRVHNDNKIKLQFVLEGDPYHPYFLWFLQQLKDGKGRSTATRTAQVVQEKPKGPPEPPKFRFSAKMPNISAKDLDVLKTTAEFTARRGENFLKELRNREANNPQFDFLRPNHSYFQYFRAIVDQYKILLYESETVERRMEELQLNINNKYHILGRAKARADYIKFQRQEKEKEEKKAEDEKKEYAAIDWHDFTVIATVEFDEADEAADLPAPTTLNDLKSRSLEQKAMTSLSTRRIEEAMPDDETYYNVSQQAAVPQPSMYPSPYAPIAPPVQAAYPAYPAYSIPTKRPHEDDQAQFAQERERQAEIEQKARANATTKGAPGRIVKDYVPRTGAKRANISTVMCPNCKQNVPSDEIEEHMRIELLDPRWKEQRDKQEARYSTTINTADVANNLRRFASQRDDIYDGAVNVPISAEEEARRKRAAMSYDGQPDPAKDAARLQQMQSTNVQEQIRRIQERHSNR